MEDKTRRTFLKVAGLSAVGAVGGPAIVAFARAKMAVTGEKQWAMAIDVNKCIGTGDCNRCKKACDAAHNVPDMSDPRYGVKPENLVRREIKWIWKEKYEGAFPEQQHALTSKVLADKDVPVMCNHCANPACVRVCPASATWKRKSDGIVMMDMHRCIGCRYCMLACPYGARSFNWMTPWPRPFDKHGAPPSLKYPTRMKGVVEKCNFCAELLAEAQRQGKSTFTPVCVEACPSKAMVFGDVADTHSEIHKILRSQHSIVRKPAMGTEPQVYYIV